MFKVLVQFKDSDKLEDVFCDNLTLDVAKKCADRWAAGCFSYDSYSLTKVVVVDDNGKVVYEIKEADDGSRKTTAS